MRFTMARPCSPLVQEQWSSAGNILQLFGHILAQAPQRAAAMGAVVIAGGQLDLLARDVIGDGTTLRLVLLLVRQAQLRGHLGDGDLAGFQSQLKLLDRLRRCPEPMAAVTGKLVAQLLDQHRLRLHFGEQKRRELPQFLGVFG